MATSWEENKLALECVPFVSALLPCRAYLNTVDNSHASLRVTMAEKKALADSCG